MSLCDFMLITGRKCCRLNYVTLILLYACIIQEGERRDIRTGSLERREEARQRLQGTPSGQREGVRERTRGKGDGEANATRKNNGREGENAANMKVGD